MDWTQLLSLAAYTTGVCYFFYTLNEKTIREWRKEHKDQIQTVEKSINEWRSEHKDQMQKSDSRFEKAMEKNELHWREMFIYMNDRIDKVREK